MNPIVPSPDPLPLPAPAPLIALLLHLTLLVHFLFMNGLLGGAALIVLSRWRSRGPGDHHARLAREVSRLLPTLFAGTVTFGVAPLLFMQALYGHFFYTSSIAIARPWFAVIPLLLLAYYGAYLNAMRGAGRDRGGRPGLARTLAAPAVLLLTAAIAFIYTNNLSLMLRPDRWTTAILADPGGGGWNLGEPTLWPRYLHMILGAIAVGGMLLAVWGRSRRDDPDFADFARRHGTAVFGWATAANVMVGLWLLFALKREVMLLMMGGSRPATILFGIGFLLAVMLRDVVRGGYLAPWHRPEAFAVRPQTLNMALFALLLIAGLALVIRMILALARGRSA